jgi:ferredoxin-type protein NapH
MSVAMPKSVAVTRRHDPATAGREAIKIKGWWSANQWLVLRRLSQLGILALFLLGPLAGIWLVKGNLSSSLTLGILPLTDPLLILQSLTTGHMPYRDTLIGGAIVVGFYLLVGGRVYCSWVCPINPVTDAAAWLRRRLGLKGGHAPSPQLRYWLIGGLMIASAITGNLVWETVNPVSLLHRGLIFGMGAGGLVVGGIFLYDLLIASRGWCGHVCPMGATYALLGRTAIPHVAATERAICDDCMDCFSVCPEPQVIRPALKGTGTPRILSPECTNCGRCIDVCSLKVFRFTLEKPALFTSLTH